MLAPSSPHTSKDSKSLPILLLLRRIRRVLRGDGVRAEEQLAGLAYQSGAGCRRGRRGLLTVGIERVCIGLDGLLVGVRGTGAVDDLA